MGLEEVHVKVEEKEEVKVKVKMEMWWTRKSEIKAEAKV